MPGEVGRGGTVRGPGSIATNVVFFLESDGEMQ